MREQHKSPVRNFVYLQSAKANLQEEQNLKLVRNNKVRVITRKKGKKIRPSEEVFNQYSSQADDQDSEFEGKSQSAQSLNFDKV